MDGEKSKGISLRKKRTGKKQISAPKQISGPLPAGFSTPGVGATAGRDIRPTRPDDARSVRSNVSRDPRGPQADKTAELVKRRYSTKVTALPADFLSGAPPLPSLPSMPRQYKQALPPPPRSPRPSGGEGQRIKVDVKALQDPNLRPEQYVASILADADREDILKYQNELRKVKHRTSADLTHNVYQNRTQFIKISKEADKLKGEMRTLRTLLSELTNTLGQTTSSAGGFQGDTLSARKQANRSSVANLEALWNTHLQTLWKRVEGSQKFLPAIPGRHIVYESSRWVELNAATWKARRRVHLILLNDHLLVAAEKKRVDASASNSRDPKQKQSRDQIQLVAQRCWPLQDVQMADLSTRGGSGRDRSESKPGATNAINIRVGNDSFTFATGSSDSQEKATLLSTFRKSVEDLRQTVEAETEERGKAQDSVNYFATRDLSILKQPELLGSLSDSRSSQVVIDVDGKQQNIRWLESQLDDLDIHIALQHFEEAVSTVEKLKKLCKSIRGNVITQDLLTFKVNERASKLASALTKQLVVTHSWLTTTRNHVEWLVRLGADDQAREAYLQARSDMIKKRARQCIFDGDLHQYIYQVSFIYFSIIKNTVYTYQSCFPPVMMSACVKWAKEHVDEFNVLLARQLSSLDQNTQTFRDCIDRARAHAGMLEEVGLDFKDLIGVEMY